MSSPSAPRKRSLRPVLRHGAPALAALVVIIVAGGAALAIGRANLGAAERDRLANRVATVDNLAANVAYQANPAADQARVAATPFAPTTGPLNDLLLQQFHTSDDPAALVALVTADGRTIASDPPGSTVDPTVFGAQWTEALSGRAVLGDLIRNRGVVTSPTLVPTGGSPPWGVLVALKPGPSSAGQAFLEQTGSLNGSPGGLVVADRRGVAYLSWSREQAGQPVLTAEQLAALPEGSSLVWSTERDGEAWTTIGRNLDNGNAFLFEQRTDDLFGDLRETQRGRDLTLLAVLAAAVAALAALQLSRGRAARRAGATTHTLLQRGHDLLLVADAKGALRFVSPSVQGLLGHGPATWTGRAVAAVSHPDDAGRLAGLLARPDSGPLRDVRFTASDGGSRSFEVEARDLTGHRPVGSVLLTCRETDSLHRLEDEISHQATHDPLTGLPNRAELDDRLDALVRDGRPTGPVALLLVDLDHFRAVNDAMGTDAGDEVLATVADRVQEAAGTDAFVCRLGGDELAVLVPGADETRAVAMAAALRDAARSPITVQSRLTRLDASIGIALASPDTPLHRGGQLVRRADQAMYEAKCAGRGRWAVASPAPDLAGGDRPSALAAIAAADRPVSATPVDGGRARACAPVTAAPDTGRPRRRWPSALVPVLVTAGLIAAVTGLGLHQSDRAQRSVEADLVRHQASFAVRAAGFYSNINNAGLLTKTVSSSPWSLDGSAVDLAVVKAFATAPASGRDAVAVLTDVSGRTLASYPPGRALGIPPSSKVWQNAVTLGQGNQVASVADPDQARAYFVLPILRGGRTAAVLALGLSIPNGPGQVALQQGGAAGSNTGGWSMVSAAGDVYMSWNPALLGSHLIDPARLAGMTPGEARDLSSEGRVLVAVPMSSTIDPSYLVFEMGAADFFRDLRVGRRQWELSLLAVVAAAAAGLALVDQVRRRSLRRDEAWLDALLLSAHDIVVVLDEELRQLFASSAAGTLLGYRSHQFQGRKLAELVHPDDLAMVSAVFADTSALGAASATDVRLRHAAGGYRWFDLDTLDLRSEPGVRGLLVTCHEVSGRRALQDERSRRAVHDPLTGLLTRAALGRRLTELTAADPSAPFAVLVVDIDHLAVVNDTIGRDAGDEVLRVIAERFLTNVRTDGGDLVCRLGGDEIAVVLRGTTEGVARATADRLIEAARQPIVVRGATDSHLGLPSSPATVQVGATVGISQSNPARHSPDTTLRHAHLAMYQAKEGDRGGYVVFNGADVRRQRV